jgi:DNA-binding IclR family transcriptional regulator
MVESRRSDGVVMSETRNSLDKAISLLRAFGDDAQLGLGVTELSRRAALTKSTGFRILSALERNGVVERAGASYRLRWIFGEPTEPDTTMHDEVRNLLTPHLAELFIETRSTVHLAMLAGSAVVYLNKLQGRHHLPSPSRIGGRMPAYCTAVGKVLLAGDHSATEAVLRAPRHAWTPHTIVDGDELLAELLRVRVGGLAHDDQESLMGLACIAAPVRSGDRVVAALSVSHDAATFRPEHVEQLLRRIAFSASGTLSAARLHLT